MNAINYQKTIENSISTLKEGEIFFLENFIDVVSDRNTIRVVLFRLVKNRVITRLAHGVFTKPRFSKLLNKEIFPDADQIAHAIARRDKARIVYAGNMALNMLGLTTQIPMKVVYYTDGSPRKISLYDSREIIFKFSSLKLFSFHSEVLQLIVVGLKHVGKGHLEDISLERVKFVMRTIDPVIYAKDRALIPDWIDRILLNIIKEES